MPPSLEHPRHSGAVTATGGSSGAEFMPLPSKLYLRAFTLVELLVAISVTLLLAAILLGLLQATSETWRRNAGRARTFQSARAAFESISQTITLATLNTYHDYYSATRQTRVGGDLAFRPDVYGRKSDLHFVTGNNLVNAQQGGALFFNAPLDFLADRSQGTNSGQLNGVGFFVRFDKDTSLPTFITNNPKRYRLFQFLQPSERLRVMNSNFPNNEWFTSDVNASPPAYCYSLAENIVAFTVLPRLSALEDPNPASLTTDYGYDSRTPWTTGAQPRSMHQLPPVVEIVMVAIDETSSIRVERGDLAPDLGFDPATIFADPTELPTNLSTISDELSEKKLNFRIFMTDIPIRAAKWSPQ